MAAVIHELWENEDKNLMILPGMLPLQEPSVTKELIRYLEPSWPPIVEADVDGPESTPLAIDRENSNLGRFSAARRVARTLFLGTAPMRGTANRGKDIKQINLGCVQPGESLATFGDAVEEIAKQSSLSAHRRRTHVLRPGSEYQPRRRIAKRRLHVGIVHDRIAELVRNNERPGGDFERIHTCPSTPADVVDDPVARLVIFSPEESHTSNDVSSAAMRKAGEFLNSRGAGPANLPQHAVFVAPDHTRLGELEDAVRWNMAWEAIHTKREELDLNQSQIRTTETKRKEWASVVGQRISETYCWLIVPTQLKSSEPVSFEAFRIRGSDSIAERTAKKLVDQGALVTIYGSNLLRMVLDDIPALAGRSRPRKTALRGLRSVSLSAAIEEPPCPHQLDATRNLNADMGRRRLRLRSRFRRRSQSLCWRVRRSNDADSCRPYKFDRQARRRTKTA